MMFLFGLAFYTKFEAWSVPLYIDTMGIRQTVSGENADGEDEDKG
jgi:hypothetical protein